ncbi:hypothetical protein J056_004640 [Wallemia ichthyophaga EXF-994]|uniref:Uncharacterized protein n=1 Tax=Wallemia ichthyophaga (strain EXF-994 / CBS 113033) TaxID=1299270 RepID=R9A8Y9_WALI9|nr:uncharacterized protein J056_004640 [Wallemia ichthyophaga EXF-994]EOQ98626.1 hypothetical protein J056_004640 [Wallemia ichthyophaga EXF-994]
MSKDQMKTAPLRPKFISVTSYLFEVFSKSSPLDWDSL